MSEMIENYFFCFFEQKRIDVSQFSGLQSFCLDLCVDVEYKVKIGFE